MTQADFDRDRLTAAQREKARGERNTASEQGSEVRRLFDDVEGELDEDFAEEPDA